MTTENGSNMFTNKDSVHNTIISMVKNINLHRLKRLEKQTKMLTMVSNKIMVDSFYTFWNFPNILQ